MMLARVVCSSAEATATWPAGGSTPASTLPQRRSAASSCATTLRAVMPRAATCTCDVCIDPSWPDAALGKHCHRSSCLHVQVSHPAELVGAGELRRQLARLRDERQQQTILKA